jgi:Transmembrane secretion effector
MVAKCAQRDDELSERFFGAFRAGLRFVCSSGELRVVLMRAAIFFTFSSALWTFLPIVARQLLGGNLTADPVEHDRGPVLVLIEYRIAKNDRLKFFECLKRLSQARRRDGAYGWGITEDAADSERIVAWFMVESWAEHLRQHHRLSNADGDIQRETTQFHVGPNPPVVRHFLALKLDDIGR